MIALIWLVLAFLSGYVGSSRRIGFWWAFLAALLLSPLLGLIFAFSSEKKSEIEFRKLQKKQVLEQQALVAEKIKEAKRQLDLGSITQDEFDCLRKKLLNI